MKTNLIQALFLKFKSFSKTDFILKIILPLFAVWMLSNTIFGLFKNQERTMEEPLQPVSISIYQNNIAGVAVTEPKSEIINIGTDRSGIVSKVYVVAGGQIKKGSKLFSIDNQTAIADQKIKTASWQSAQIQTKDAKSQLEMIESLPNKEAFSKDEVDRKRFAYQLAQKKEQQAKAELAMNQLELEKLTVKSPINGQVLKVNLRVGEYIFNNSVNNQSLISIGDLSKMNLRVEIDESNINQFNQNSPATAVLRGNPKVKIPLHFVRIEPLVVSKVSIAGNGAKAIDTRVIQVIYSFDNINLGILVGQELDVYIQTQEQKTNS